MGLMQDARTAQASKGAGFKKPDVSAFVPPDMKDTVDRVTAAGMKVMYDPTMREELMSHVEADSPPAESLARGATALLFELEAKSNGGIPKGAMFPAAMELLGEFADTMTAAGTPITQDEYNQAAHLMFVMIARKLGASDDQIMQGAEQVAGGGQAQEAPTGGPAAAPDEEEAAMQAAMQGGA